MLDTYISPRPRTEYVTRAVHEHRAPTDESVRLLREMESAAEANRIASMTIDNNLFKGVVHIDRDMCSDRLMAKAIVDLNGHRMTVEHDIPRCDLKNAPELMAALHEKLASKIAGEILADSVKGMRF